MSESSLSLRLQVSQQGIKDYLPVWQRMKDFTHQRSPQIVDQCWVLQHKPVFTLGQAGNPEHILMATDIPVIKSDRGGQVTYHGPGQLVVYPLVDMRRKKLGVRDLVTAYESIIIDVLDTLAIKSYARTDAPGVYVDYLSSEHKIASLGLRVHKGCAYHGFCLNVSMDLSPFTLINPCGYSDMAVCAISNFVKNVDINKVQELLISSLIHHLGYNQVEYLD